ncbi:class I SAM-dependent methyltransferase [Leucothrix sargassi]|nr:class I SAM-dependent methyltransferase [Leucothrix sargassi]
MTDVKTSKESMQSFAHSWDQQVRRLWPETYPESLSLAFKALNVSSILDCAGGTGYPAIELKQMGWDISYSDGSELLTKSFKERIEALNLDIPAYESRWEELTKNIPKTYDALMCSGNSFVTINTYDNNLPLTEDNVRQSMQKALGEFYKTLNSGGVLYIDIFNNENATPESPFSVVLEDESHRSFNTVSYDSARNVRTLLSTVISLSDGSEQDVISKLIPINSEHLINSLKEAGFSRIEHAETDDADYVNSFFAFKD